MVTRTEATIAVVSKPGATMTGKRKRHPRKRLKGAPTHVISQALRPTLAHLAVVDTRLESARRVYNACLGEAFARCRAMRVDPAFEAAKALDKGPPKSDTSAARSKAFADVAATHGFTSDALRTYGSRLRKGWVRDHVGAQEAQRLAARAFDAVKRWNMGLGGRPRFKNARRGLRSLECSDRYGDMQPVVEKGHLVAVRWGKTIIPVAGIPEHPTGRAGREAAMERARLEMLIANGGLLQMRIVRNVISGRPTLRAQFVVDGHPLIRHETGTGTISADVGPSIMSVVAADEHGNPVPEAIGHHVMAEGIGDIQAELRRLQRHLERQHRAGSPACFDEKGRHKKVCEWWEHRSKSASSTIDAIAELHRRAAATRTTLHGRLVNELLAFGVNVRAEDLNYTAWQKMYPRSLRDRAVGEVMALLFRRAENAGGQAYHYSPRSTALSQTCVCGHKERKPLSQRRHRCSNCKREAQRDLFSAFLGLYVHARSNHDGTSTDLLDLEGAANNYAAFAPHLQEAGGLPRSRSTKHRGQGRRSRRSMARITARHKRRSNTTEVLGTTPEPDHTTPTTSGELVA